jgi:peptide/nickel transport system ATP-binding protein
LTEDLLTVHDLKTYFPTEDGLVRAVDGISFKIKKKEIVGIVGESGCGKSMTAMSILRLIDPPGKIESGEILFDGVNLTKLKETEMQKIRGGSISVIFQEPMTSLNPVFTIGEQIEEAIMLHQGLDKAKARESTVKMLNTVGIPQANEVVDEYPHELSGGMRQRAMIAMAISCNPKLLIADEPTTALDVTIQAQILELMKDLQNRLGSSIMLITHDLGVIAEMASYVIVMYAGKIVEEAEVTELFKHAKHPYTSGLLQSKPVIVRDEDRLKSIPGQVPNPLHMPAGCYFHPRCEFAIDKCRESRPLLKEVCKGHKTACWLYEGVK